MWLPGILRTNRHDYFIPFLSISISITFESSLVVEKFITKILFLLNLIQLFIYFEIYKGISWNRFFRGSILEINIQFSYKNAIEIIFNKINYYFFQLYIYIMRSCFEKEMKNKKNWYYSMVVHRHLRNSINSVINAQKKKKKTSFHEERHEETQI